VFFGSIFANNIMPRIFIWFVDRRSLLSLFLSVYRHTSSLHTLPLAARLRNRHI